VILLGYEILGTEAILLSLSYFSVFWRLENASYSPTWSLDL